MLMESFNDLDGNISTENLKTLAILISPFFPHLAEEIWEKLGQSESIFTERWPKYDAEYLKLKKIKIAIQVNGKLRDVIEIDVGLSQKEVEEKALTAKVQLIIGPRKIARQIYVPGKIVNFVLE